MTPDAGLTHTQIAGCFNRGMGRQHRVRLIGGSDEPLYQPGGDGVPATIRYTRDYPASALHELAHWCIAGAARRKQTDYGYWYRPPPRTAAEQQAFCAVEVQVQALESRFAAACGTGFRVSVDDVSGSVESLTGFSAAVEACVRQQDVRCLSRRALKLLEDFTRLRRQLDQSRGGTAG